MMTAFNKIFKRTIFYKNGIIKIGLLVGIIIVIAAADMGWMYLAGLLAPVLIYLSFKKPFVFPFGAYIFLLPFDSVLSIMGITQGATLTKLLGVLTILVLLLKGLFEKKLKWPDKASIYWVLFVVYGLLSISWAIEPQLTLSLFSTVIGLLVLYLIASSYKIDESEFSTCKWCIFLGGFISALYMIYSYRKGFFYTFKTMRATIGAGESISNPNVVAFNLLMPIAVCIQMILNQNRKILKVMLIVVLGIILFSIILTGSRGAFVGVLVIFFIYTLFMKKRMALWAILLTIGIILMLFLPEFYLERWKEAAETGGSGRLTIWRSGLEALKNFWILGVGLNNFPIVYNEFGHFTPFSTKLYRGSHNIYLGTFVELGIIGFSLLVLVIMKHYQKIKSQFNPHNSNRVLLIAALCGILTQSFFMGTVWLKSFWLLWMMIMMHQNAMKRENKLVLIEKYLQRQGESKEELFT